MPWAFEDEHEFAGKLAKRLDGVWVQNSVKRRSEPSYGGLSQLQAEYDRNGSQYGPDIILRHELDDLTNPAFIECKIGEAFTKRDIDVSYPTTGLKQIQSEFEGQLRRYKNSEWNSEEPTPEDGWTVFVTCPYMLHGIYHDKQLDSAGSRQFSGTLRNLDLGWVFRHENGIVLREHETNSYLVWDRGSGFFW